MDVKKELDRRQRQLSKLQNENDLLLSQARAAEDEMVQAAESMQIAQDALSFLEELANSRRGAMRGRIESIQTEALRLVYGQNRKIELAYSVKNNRSHLDFELVKETPAGEVRRVLDGNGNGMGVSDVVSVPLRLLVLLGSKQADRVCVLDECYKHLDGDRIPLIAQFLQALAKRMHMQILLFTHHEQLRYDVDVAYGVREGPGHAIVEKMKNDEKHN